MAIATERGTIGSGATPVPREGMTTRRVEQFTGRVPSLVYMGLAVGSMAMSAGFMLAKRREAANFVGQWVPALLIIGLYNKLVKVEESITHQHEEQPMAGV